MAYKPKVAGSIPAGRTLVRNTATVRFLSWDKLAEVLTDDLRAELFIGV